MDILSEVLRVVRLSGAMHFSGEFRAPWSFVTSTPTLMAARLKVAEGSVTPFHVVVEGGCWVTSGSLPPLRLEAGDVVVFPRGDQHVMASAVELAPVPIDRIYTPSGTGDVTTLRYGGSGGVSRFLCGYLHAGQQFDPLLSCLPAVLCVRVRDDGLVLETLGADGHQTHRIDHPQQAWWLASLRYLIVETETPGPGNRAVLARLAEALFVEILRWHLQHGAPSHGGWLAGLHDPQLARALTLLHGAPERPWTVATLAREAATSRAALAKRFVELIGQSPIQYLASWRMHLARHLLGETTLGIGAIAGRVGYESEAAFNRAFRRLVGTPPATWRHASQLDSRDPPTPRPRGVRRLATDAREARGLPN